MFDVESILRTADLKQLVDQAGGKVDNHGHSNCPLHGGDNMTGFHVYQKEGHDVWNCFSGSCGGGDAITFVQKWQGMNFKEACAFLHGDVTSDPVAMERSAQERLERARLEHEEARLKMEARRTELQVAQRHLFYHDNRPIWAREMWTARGLDEGLQDFFTLGACEDFTINDGYHTPTLTIPIFSETRSLLNIKHRLLNPIKPKDKYRPETSGLGAFPPLLAVPEMGYDGGLIICVEGEIKAMITWARLDISDIQVIGVAGRNAFKSLAEQIKDKPVIVIPDPGAEKEAVELARMVKGKVFEVPMKIDDYLIQTNITSNNFYSQLKQARQI